MIATAGTLGGLFIAWLSLDVSLLGGLGLLLTLGGIASVTAYAEARRTREIGVRMAFGAAPQSVVWTWPGRRPWRITSRNVCDRRVAARRQGSIQCRRFARNI